MPYNDRCRAEIMRITDDLITRTRKIRDYSLSAFPTYSKMNESIRLARELSANEIDDLIRTFQYCQS